jgi:hypothetical protein
VSIGLIGSIVVGYYMADDEANLELNDSSLLLDLGIVTIVIALLAGATALIARLLRRSLKSKRQPRSVSRPPPESPGHVASELEPDIFDQTVISHQAAIEQRIASELESEMLRRTASQQEGGS